MAANYDNTAWFYERLSYLVFGQSQVKAQNYFLNNIKPASRILIIGGGTGQILEALTRLYPSGLDITYVEISGKMVALSQKRNTGQNAVTFVADDIANVTAPLPYDVIITAFLFDNFSEPHLQQAFGHIHEQLTPNGLWLNTDFQLTGPIWQKVLLKTMYLFFKVLGAVDTIKLPDTNRIFNQYHYNLAQQKTFYKSFITTRLYLKQAA